MKETLKNYLLLRGTELTLLGQKEYWDTKVANEALDAWAEMSLKVRESKSKSEIKHFYLDNLEKFHTFIRRHEKVIYDFKKLEQEYKNLYDRYSEQVEINTRLQKEFDRI